MHFNVAWKQTSSLYRLQRIINSAIRIKTKTSRQNHINSVLHRVPVEFQSITDLYHVWLHGLMSVCIQYLVNLYLPARLLHSRNQRWTLCPTLRSNQVIRIGNNHFDVRVAILSLDIRIRREHNLSSFKEYLKIHSFYIALYYSSEMYIVNNVIFYWCFLTL